MKPQSYQMTSGAPHVATKFFFCLQTFFRLLQLGISANQVDSEIIYSTTYILANKAVKHAQYDLLCLALAVAYTLY